MNSLNGSLMCRQRDLLLNPAREEEIKMVATSAKATAQKRLGNEVSLQLQKQICEVYTKLFHVAWCMLDVVDSAIEWSFWTCNLIAVLHASPRYLGTAMRR